MIVVADAQLGRVPHAFVVLKPRVSLSEARKKLRERLDPSHFPKKFHVVSEIPRTGSGKVRASLLLNPDNSSEGDHAIVHP